MNQRNIRFIREDYILSIKLPIELPTFCFERAKLSCNFAPSHEQKHLRATKKASAIFINLNIFN